MRSTSNENVYRDARLTSSKTDQGGLKVATTLPATDFDGRLLKRPVVNV
jgi:hypothetical protein